MNQYKMTNGLILWSFIPHAIKKIPEWLWLIVISIIYIKKSYGTVNILNILKVQVLKEFEKFIRMSSFMFFFRFEIFVYFIKTYIEEKFSYI